jgi:hypothetical protein
MKALFQSILTYLAAASENDLANQIQYLKIENEILRGKLPKRIAVTPRERNRLLKYGKLVGAAIGQLISIVTPRTFQRWIHEEGATKTKKVPPSIVGRPKTNPPTLFIKGPWVFAFKILFPAGMLASESGGDNLLCEHFLCNFSGVAEIVIGFDEATWV